MPLGYFPDIKMSKAEYATYNWADDYSPGWDKIKASYIDYLHKKANKRVNDMITDGLYYATANSTYTSSGNYDKYITFDKYDTSSYPYYATSSTASTSAIQSYVTLKWLSDHGYIDASPFRQQPVDRMREIIRARLAPAVHIRRKSVMPADDPREERARETLRRVIGEERYLRFLKHGFVTVRNRQSGRVYQIYRGHEFTNVYLNGEQIARLCIILRGNFAPTDVLITRMLLALNDEKTFWDLAIKHSIPTQHHQPERKADERSLPVILQAFKAAA